MAENGNNKPNKQYGTSTLPPRKGTGTLEWRQPRTKIPESSGLSGCTGIPKPAKIV